MRVVERQVNYIMARTSYFFDKMMYVFIVLAK